MCIRDSKAAEIAQKAHTENITLKDAALELGYLTAEEFDRIVIPANMVWFHLTALVDNFYVSRDKGNFSCC